MKLDPGMVGSNISQTICILHDKYAWNWQEISVVFEMWPVEVYNYYKRKIYAHRWNLKPRVRKPLTEAQRERRRVTGRALAARKRAEKKLGLIKV